MNLKKLYISAAILAVIALITSFLKRPGAAPLQDEREGKSIVEIEELRDATSLTIVDDGESVTIGKGADGKSWTVAEREGYPADESKLTGDIQDLTDATILRLVSSKPERIADLGFATGASVAINNASGKSILAFQLGKSAGSDRQFLKFDGEEKAFMIDALLNFDAEADAWLDKDPLEIESGDVRQIQASLNEGDSLSLRRENAEADWTAEDLPEGKIVDQAAVKRMVDRLTGLNFMATAAPDEAEVTGAKANSHRFQLTTENDTRYAIEIGRQPEVKTTQEVEKTNDAGETTTESEEVVETPEGAVYFSVRNLTDDAAPMNKFTDSLAFEASAYQFTSLPSSIEDLITDAPEPEPTPAAEAPEDAASQSGDPNPEP